MACAAASQMEALQYHRVSFTLTVKQMGIIDIVIADKILIVQILEVCSESVVNCLTTHGEQRAALISF